MHALGGVGTVLVIRWRYQIVHGGRFVGVGAGDYTMQAHRKLAHAADDVLALRQVLGDFLSGEPLINPDESELRDFLKALKRSMPDGGPLVVVWSGHGFSSVGGLRLPVRDSGADADDGFAVSDVVGPCALSGANQVLFVFDTCFSGEAIPAGDLATQIMRQAQPSGQVWVGVMSSCLSVETARDGLFGKLLRKILAEGPDAPELRVRWSSHNEYVRGDDLCDAVLKEWGSGIQSPDFQSRGSAWWMVPNPLYRPEAPEQVVEHLLLAARGGASVDERSWFTGRTSQVNQVVGWVHGRRPGLHVVTGSAGTGKSAIVGRVVSLSNPDERRRLLDEGRVWSHVLPRERSVHAHVHARGLTADLAADLLAGQLVQRHVLKPQEMRRNASELVGQVQRAVEDGAQPPVVVVDGLDEARGEAFTIAEELLTRLAPHAVVIVSTRDMQRGDSRPSLVSTLAPEGADMDLDDPAIRQQGRADLADYVRLRLEAVDPRMDAAVVAAHLAGAAKAGAQQNFMLARLVTDQLTAAPLDTTAAGWQDKVSGSIEDAIDTDLANVAPAPDGQTVRVLPSTDLAGTVLRALTWGYGAGFPEDEWLCVANALMPDSTEVTREELSWVLDQLGRHIVQDGEAGVAVYRMAHQSLADHLRRPYGGSPEQPFNPQALAVARALLTRYRALLSGEVPAEAPAYLWRYVWRHVADAGPGGLDMLRSLSEENPALQPDVASAALSTAERFRYWGRRVDAVALGEEAVRLRRGLAGGNPAFVPDLAAALNNLGIRYSEVGRRVDAVAPAEEAVRLYSGLAEDNPAFVSDLAGALNNLGAFYREVGRRVDAVALGEEAVRLRRGLAGGNPAFVSDLAAALNNLGAFYSAVGRRVDAVAPVEEAVRLRRGLAGDNPAFVSDLAGALNNLGTRYSEVGRRVDAVAPAEEAVRLYRGLAGGNPAFVPDLAAALNNLGVRYSEVGRRVDAVAPAEEAVRLRRGLAGGNPAFVSDLAGALNNLGAFYREVGRRVDAVAPVEEAVRLYRGLAGGNPAFVSDLAAALNNLGIRYSEVGRRVDAVAPAEEAVRLHRGLAGGNPAFVSDLAAALNNLGIRYSEVGRRVDAVAPAEEAVRLYRGLAGGNPAFVSDLAAALNNLGIRYSEVGRRVDAVAPAEEAVRLRRGLAEDNPAFVPNLAGALNNLGASYSEVGRRVDAVAPVEEAVRLYRGLAGGSPAFVSELAGALNNLGAFYSAVGRRVDAVAPVEEAVRLYRGLAGDNPAFVSDLAGALNNLGAFYSAVGRRVDAVAPAEEAVRLYRGLAGDNPAFVPNLAAALNNLGVRYSEMGRNAEDAWAEVLSHVDLRTAAFLLLFRASRAQAGDTDVVAWLATVVEIAEDVSEFLGVLHAEGRRHRAAAGPEAFDEVWREHTGAEPPAWFSIDVDLVAVAQAWVETETFTAERDHLAAHPELLTPEADSAVEEVLLLIGQEAQRYRDIRRAAQNDSVESAYRPLLLTILAQEFAVADPPSQRRLLGERREDLLDDIVLDVLSRLVADSTPQNSPKFTQAQALLQLAQLGEHRPALDALEDPSRFPELLQEHARRPDPAPLHPTAVLALTAATSAQLAATAVFHLAVATTLSGDTDQAGQLLISAHELLPEAGAAWINDLADIAHHHRAALSLIPTLTRQPPADSPEEPDAPN